jgi:hypothetical protein
LGIPPIAITPDKVENNTPKKEGVKGMLPACCLPLWGREGVTLIAATENYRMTEKRGFQQSLLLLKYLFTYLNFEEQYW